MRVAYSTKMSEATASTTTLVVCAVPPYARLQLCVPSLVVSDTPDSLICVKKSGLDVRGAASVARIAAACQQAHNSVAVLCSGASAARGRAAMASTCAAHRRPCRAENRVGAHVEQREVHAHACAAQLLVCVVVVRGAPADANP